MSVEWNKGVEKVHKKTFTNIPSMNGFLTILNPDSLVFSLATEEAAAKDMLKAVQQKGPRLPFASSPPGQNCTSSSLRKPWIVCTAYFPRLDVG